MKTIAISLLIFMGLSNLFSQNSDWVYRNPLPQNDFYAIKFFNQNTGYVCGSGGVILKNTTGSNNWITVQSNTSNNLYGMYWFDVTHGYIVGAGGMIMYTSDGGNSWTHIATSNGYALRSITFLNANTGFVCGDNGELYKTTSGITGWIPISVTSTNLRSVFFVDSLTGYACGANGLILKTTNAGTNWQSQTAGTSTLTSVYFRNALTGFISDSSHFSSNTPYSTTNGGVTWQPLTFFRIQSSWGSVKFKNQDTGFFAGNNNLIMHTTNGGLAWFEQGVPQRTFLNDICIIDSLAFVCGNDGWIYETTVSGYSKCLGGSKQDFSLMTFLNENTGIIVTDFSYMRTVNGAASWNPDFFGGFAWEEGCATIQTDIRSFTPTSVYRVTKDVNCHGGLSFYHLNNSTDGGLTWNGDRFFGQNAQTNIGIPGFCETEGITYVTAYTNPTGIFKNSGTGWAEVYSGNYLGQISFANQNTGVVISQYPNPAILRTTNGGINWIITNTGSTKSLSDLVLMPSGAGFLCGDSSFIMHTTDYGITWSQISLSGTTLFTKLQFINNSTGWLLGYNQTSYNLYYTNNGCANVQRLLSLGNFNVKGFSFVNANTGYVCGDSGVVLKTTNGGITFVNANNNSVPSSFSLSQNYPNPFNPVTTIKFDIPNAGTVPRTVSLIIYDILGKEVSTILNEQLQPGSYSVDWDASNYPSGVYFYKLEAGDFTESKKMVLLK